MKLLIIEDEKHNANRLQLMVKEIDKDIEVIDILESVADSIAWFATNKEPDLILMDVRLSDGLCFEIFSGCVVTSPVIFTTAYDEYALRAFKVNSIDYLLKPIHRPELERALLKFKNLVGSQQTDPAISSLVEVVRKQGIVYRTRFLIQVNDGYKTIPVKDVDYIYSEFKVIYLALDNGQIQSIPYTMDELEEQLDPALFFRANRQHIITIHSIKDIHNSFNGKLKVTLFKYPHVEILISRDKATAFKQWLDR